VKIAGVMMLLLSASLVAFGQQSESVTLDDTVQSAQDWANENLDTNALAVLQSVDQEKVKQFLDEIQKQFNGEYVIDLAQLKDAARAILPLLESHEETLPYAEWLKPRIDYLEAADELRLVVPPPKTEPGKPTPPWTNPQPQLERDIWIKKLADRPWPEGAKPYVTKLKSVFAEQQVPPQLVWIAEVESSFDPRARSPVGAAGLFQLMPATARQYGLRTWPFDQRLNAEESARAAARYLAYLYGRFHDWRLALAAYNAGEGTVRNLLDRYHTTTYDAIATHLPAETQMYVPKVEGVLLRREGVKLADLPPLGR
jgi:peptidoglycan lytic transglycosylase D